MKDLSGACMPCCCVKKLKPQGFYVPAAGVHAASNTGPARPSAQIMSDTLHTPQTASVNQAYTVL
jgi:hypothetical protein